MEQERSTTLLAALKRMLPCMQPVNPGATARLGAGTVRGLALLLLAAAVIGVSATGIVALRRGTSQVVLITFQDPQGHWVNQSARIDPEENVVTYSIKSLANRSAVVLFDGKNELVCYQPRGNICLVRQMTTNELENIQTFLTTMEHRSFPEIFEQVLPWLRLYTNPSSFSQLLLWRNETHFSKEFLGILTGHVVDSLSVGKHINSLCDKSRIYWVQKRNDAYQYLTHQWEEHDTQCLVHTPLPDPTLTSHRKDNVLSSAPVEPTDLTSYHTSYSDSLFSEA